MVTNVTSFGKNGLYDWVVQRSTAVILGIYAVCIASFFASHPGVGFEAWKAYITSTSMVIFSSIALVSIALHAWIGLWTVSTDYITTRQLGNKATSLRLAFQAIYMLVNVVYVLWGFKILWGA
jgi:succinate dehydrogenase / fumarate reductase membrane anchor subunit